MTSMVLGDSTLESLTASVNAPLQCQLLLLEGHSQNAKLHSPHDRPLILAT
jgi:hypothetical protein